MSVCNFTHATSSLQLLVSNCKLHIYNYLLVYIITITPEGLTYIVRFNPLEHTANMI